ncbi:uncharacterized protein RHO17_015233 [Thomomys bottae]
MEDVTLIKTRFMSRWLTPLPLCPLPAESVPLAQAHPSFPASLNVGLRPSTNVGRFSPVAGCDSPAAQRVLPEHCHSVARVTQVVFQANSGSLPSPAPRPRATCAAAPGAGSAPAPPSRPVDTRRGQRPPCSPTRSRDVTSPARKNPSPPSGSGRSAARPRSPPSGPRTGFRDRKARVPPRGQEEPRRAVRKVLVTGSPRSPRPRAPSGFQGLCAAI